MKDIKEKLLHLNKLDEVLRVENLEGHKVAIFHDGVGVQDMIQLIMECENTQGNDDAFTIVNLTTLYNRCQEWREKIPRIQPFYAIKCNSDALIAKVLADLGCGFDCASDEELRVTVGKKLTTVENVIYANPVKQRSFIEFADQLGVNKMTFDNAEELDKIKELHKHPELVLRIRVDDPSADNNLGVKFGCDPPLEKGEELLKVAKEKQLPVIGISFHVGSRAHDPNSYRRGLQYCKKLFDIGKQLGHDMYFVDIGGGYPGFDTDKVSFDKMAECISSTVDECFPENEHKQLRMISEPGRFFATTAISLMVHVIGATRVPASRITKKKEDDDKEGYMYYLNDGCHGSFNSIVYDHARPIGQTMLLTKTSHKCDQTYPTMIWGPTCAGTDQIEPLTEMRKLGVGDWIFYPHMGAYTSVSSSHFNGFKTPVPYYVMNDSTWQALYGDKTSDGKPKSDTNLKIDPSRFEHEILSLFNEE